MFVSLVKLIIQAPVTFMFSVWALLTIPFDRSGGMFYWFSWRWIKIDLLKLKVNVFAIEIIKFLLSASSILYNIIYTPSAGKEIEYGRL